MKRLDRLGNLALLLNQQGVLVLVDAEDVPQETIRSWQDLLPHFFESSSPADQAPEGAGNSARLILNRLLESGLMDVAGHWETSTEDHEALKKRLRDLGYL